MKIDIGTVPVSDTDKEQNERRGRLWGSHANLQWSGTPATELESRKSDRHCGSGLFRLCLVLLLCWRPWQVPEALVSAPPPDTCSGAAREAPPKRRFSLAPRG